MIFALLLACAALQAVVPTADAPAARTTSADEETLYDGEEPCRSGTWTVACPTCAPAWTRSVVFDCLGVADAPRWSVELLDQVLVDEGGLDDVREARPGEDWNITIKRK